MTDGGEIFSRKGEYEAKKAEKVRSQKRRSLLKLAKHVGVWMVVILTILFTAGGVLFSLWQDAGQPNVTALENSLSRYPLQGREHIPVGAAHPAYNSNPPTSGWHYEKPAKWGIYEEELADEQIVHNLEHCGIWISYQPTLSPDLKAVVLNFAKQFPTKMIVTPRAANDAPIVFASWGVLMKLDRFDQDKAEAFVTSFLNRNGPECQAP
jgi:hypothetical protein